MKTPLTAALAGALVLSACVSVLPEQKVPDALYRISAPTGSAEATSNVVIREPDAPRIFAGTEMVSENSAGGLRLVPRVGWADRATRLFQSALLDEFSKSSDGYVVDDTSGVSGEYELSWRIADLKLQSGRAVCELDLTLLSGGVRKPVAKTRVSESESITGEADNAARAQALAVASRACIAATADFIETNATPADADD